MRRWIISSCIIMATTSVVNSQTLDSTNLPIVIIDTKGQVIKDSPRIQCDMKIIFNAADTIQRVTDTTLNYSGKVSIEYRGSSSQMFPKKSMSVETQNADSTSKDAALLGMPADNDWILFAAYNDNTLVRDVMSYQLSNEIGLYATRCRYCELIINNQYQGLYVLIEKIKQGKYRVDVENLTILDITGDSLTGGYIFKFDKTTGDDTEGWYPKYVSNYWTSYQYHYPRYDKMMPQQKTYIKNFVNSFENVMYGKDYADSLKGYSKYIDTISFIKYILMSEISKNIDEYRISTFYNKHKDSKGGKIYAGPIWDYGLTYGLPDYNEGFNYTGWEIDYSDNPFFWSKLFKEPRFHNKLVYRWRNLRKTTFAYDHIEHIIDSLVHEIDSARTRNFQRWPILGTYVWPNYFINSSYAPHVTYLKNWIDNRLKWMDKNLVIVAEPKPPVPPKPDTTSLIISDQEGIKAWPNPFTDHLDIDLGENSCAIISIVDISGRLIYYFNSPINHIHWDGRDLSGNNVPMGMYILQVITKNASWNKMILKN